MSRTSNPALRQGSMGGRPFQLGFNVVQVLKKQEKSVEQEEQFQVQLECGAKESGRSRKASSCLREFEVRGA